MILGRFKHWRHAAFLLLWSGLASATPVPRVESQAQRDFGYALGDIVERAFTVAVPEGYALETGFLPQAGALDEYLEVRHSDWSLQPRDGESTYRIRIAYQVFKGVRSAEKTTIPALPLRFQGPSPLEATIPESTFTLAPLIPPDLPDEQVIIRGAAPPISSPTRPHVQRLLAYLGTSLALVATLAWRRYGRTRRNRPFARARREFKRLIRHGTTPETLRAQAKLLHQALNETAGHSLFAEQLGGFCADRPAFAELRGELADFFALSRRLFFAAPETLAADDPATRLEALCRRCAQAERRRV